MKRDEFANLIKQKYPDYASIDNEQLVNSVLSKHPEYQSQVDSQPSNPMVDVAKQAVQTAMPTQDFMKPLSTTSPNPIIGGAQAALQTLRDPTRISPTVSQPGQIVGEAVKKATGSGVAGFVTSVLADPQTYLGAGTGKLPKSMENQVSKLGEVLTGVDKENFIKLANDPASILSAPSSQVTGKAYGAAKAAAGVTDAEERALALSDIAKKRVYKNVMATLDNGQTPTVSDMLMAKKAGWAIASRDPSASGLVSREISEKLNPALKEAAPDVYAAQQANHLSQVKESFMNLFPQGKGMMNYFRTISMLAGSAFHGIGALESPAVSGAATLAGSQAIKYGLTPGGMINAVKGFPLSQISPDSFSNLQRLKAQANGQ